MTFRDVLTEFYAEQEYKGNRPATLRFYQQTVGHFLKDTGLTSLEDFSERTIRTWLLSHRGLSPNTLGAYDRALRSISNWLYLRGYLPQHPMKNLPKPRAKRVEIITFTADEIHSMLAEAKRRRNPLRDKALIILLLDTGIRIGEACNLQLQNVQWSENCLLVDGKTGQRQVPFGRKAKQALRAYVDRERKACSSGVRGVFLNQDGTPLKSLAATQRLGKIAKVCNVKATKLGPHTFRHTFGVEFIRAGGDAFTLQRLLGHTTLEVTRRYVHLAQSDLREAHRRFSPGNRLL